MLKRWKVTKAAVKIVVVAVVATAAARISPPVAALTSAPDLAANRPLTASAFEAVKGQELGSRIARMLREQPRLVELRAASGAKLANVGLMPTEFQAGTVVRGLKRVARARPQHLLGQLLDHAVPSLQAQENPAQMVDIGFIVADAWTDGDDSTWEGNYWGYLFEAEAAFSMSFQLSIPSSIDDGVPKLLQNWGGTMSHSRRGSVPISSDVFERGLGQIARASLIKDVMTAPRSSGLLPDTTCACSLAGNPDGALANCFIGNVLGDSWQTCAAAAIGCAFFGPGWVVCVSAACGGWMAVELVEEMASFAWNCWLPE